jgi:hypothetical protein
MKRIIVICDGCGETWEADPRSVGTNPSGVRCAGYDVRPATEAEARGYCASVPVCWCESDSYSIPCEVH